MRLLLHDYSGHPFQVELARALARRGHEVLHVHCASFSTGKGALEVRPGDPATLRIEGIRLAQPFSKYAPVQRFRQEREYGRAFVALVDGYRPDVVLSSNTPLLSQQLIQRWARQRGHRFVFWQQDIYSIAMQQAARKRLPVVGGSVGELFVGLERRMLQRSDAVVAISEDFRPVLSSWSVDPESVHVVENWAPRDELRPAPRRNAWSAEHGLDDAIVLLYSGTIGLKHDPGLLLELAQRWRHDERVKVVVVSEGRGADWLRAQLDDQPLDNLLLLPFQPFDRLGEVLSSGDVLLAILEADAGVFSVPSKVLSYHCVGRPIVASVPGENLAARIIERERSGLVVPPNDRVAMHAATERLVADAVLRAGMGASARGYADAAFDIEAIADRFEPILIPASPGGGAPTMTTTRQAR
jgi:glycosyltransferase involved in cell wall biosynthesis